MEKEDVVFSVIMCAYNHERYIAQAIESVVSQETEFKFELIVGEDCSTDGTRKIVREYQKKYPEIVKPVYYKKNMGGTKNAYCLIKKTRGKYIAACEGDDFWCDPKRIQNDVVFLEQHQEYVGICNRCKVVDVEGKEIKENIDSKLAFWEFDKTVYTLGDFEDWKLPGHCSTITTRNIFLDKSLDYRIIYQASGRVGDRTGTLLKVLYGDIYCGKKIVSCYRYRVSATENNFMSQYAEKNLRDEDFLMMRRLEHWVWKQKGICLDLGKARRERFIGSVVVWMKNPTKGNRHVVTRIIKNSGEPIKYIGYGIKIWILKNYYWKIKHTDKLITL